MTPVPPISSSLRSLPDLAELPPHYSPPDDMRIFCSIPTCQSHETTLRAIHAVNDIYHWGCTRCLARSLRTAPDADLLWSSPDARSIPRTIAAVVIKCLACPTRVVISSSTAGQRVNPTILEERLRDADLPGLTSPPRTRRERNLPQERERLARPLTEAEAEALDIRCRLFTFVPATPNSRSVTRSILPQEADFPSLSSSQGRLQERIPAPAIMAARTVPNARTNTEVVLPSSSPTTIHSEALELPPA